MLLGHQDKIKVFKNLVESGNLSQAYLFYGYPQIGKFYFSKLLANFLESGQFEILAEKPLIDACFFSSLDSVGIDTVREIKKFLWQKPFKSSRRLAVLDNAENLTREAESALLKIVEEPPSKALIIFIASDRRVLFEPLLSRLTAVYFPSFSKSEIEKFLQKEKDLSKKEAAELARLSFGSIGRAIALAEKRERTVGKEDLLSALQEKIAALYLKGVSENHKVLSRLLKRATALSRFNLNANLLKKAIEFELKL